MHLTKPLLLAKRQLALATRDELAAKLNAQVGVIETLDHLLAILDQPEPPPENPSTH